ELSARIANGLTPGREVRPAPARPASLGPIGYRSDAQLAPMVHSRGTRPDEPPAPPTRWHPTPAGEVGQSPRIVVPSYSPLCSLPRSSAATGAGGNSRARKYALARASRDITVPNGTSICSAISR